MIKSYENTLKHIIIDVLGASDQADYNISDDVKEKWFEKRSFESQKNDGFLTEKRILFYADFFDLKTIISKNWDEFEPVLKNKERFLVFFNEVNQYQNLMNLGKALTKSQEEMLSGILADLKNNYSIFTNKKNQRNKHFVVINSISDNIGTTWEPQQHKTTTKPVLTVGDSYELLIDANDPKDRDIEYELYHFAGKLRIKQNSNRFNFKITEDLIGLTTILVVKATTPSSKYINEFILKIQITVLPD